MRCAKLAGVHTCCAWLASRCACLDLRGRFSFSTTHPVQRFGEANEGSFLIIKPSISDKLVMHVIPSCPSYRTYKSWFRTIKRTLIELLQAIRVNSMQLKAAERTEEPAFHAPVGVYICVIFIEGCCGMYVLKQRLV